MIWHGRKVGDEKNRRWLSLACMNTKDWRALKAEIGAVDRNLRKDGPISVANLE